MKRGGYAASALAVLVSVSVPQTPLAAHQRTPPPESRRTSAPGAGPESTQPTRSTSASPRGAEDGARPRSRVISSVEDGGRNLIALTLDDGYGADPRLLDLVEERDLRGTAFIVGQVAESTPWLVERLVELGWEVCSHTYSHKILTKLSEAGVENEIGRGQRSVREASGQACPYFRPPGGAVNGTVVRVAERLGLTVVNWNASISDSTSRSTDPAVQVAIALRTIRPGGILLGHFGGAHSYEVLKEVLDTIVARGYRVGSVGELLDTGGPAAAPLKGSKLSLSAPAGDAPAPTAGRVQPVAGRDRVTSAALERPQEASTAGWSPPGGWIVTLYVLTALAVAVYLASRRRRRPDPLARQWEARWKTVSLQLEGAKSGEPERLLRSARDVPGGDGSGPRRP